MMRIVRNSWAARLAVLAVLLGLLAQSVLAGPARLAMAQVTPICGTAHGSFTDDGPGPPQHDHAHCVLCQGHSAPLLADAVPVARPTACAFRADTRPDDAGFIAAVETGFLSRAPPSLA